MLWCDKCIKTFFRLGSLTTPWHLHHVTVYGFWYSFWFILLFKFRCFLPVWLWWSTLTDFEASSHQLSEGLVDWIVKLSSASELCGRYFEPFMHTFPQVHVSAEFAWGKYPQFIALWCQTSGCREAYRMKVNTQAHEVQPNTIFTWNQSIYFITCLVIHSLIFFFPNSDVLTKSSEVMIIRQLQLVLPVRYNHGWCSTQTVILQLLWLWRK